MAKQFSLYTVLVVCIACFLATSVVVPLWTSPIFPKLYYNDISMNPIGRPITANEASWIGSLLILGAVIGPFPFGFVTAKFGRKIGLLATSVPIIISFFTLAFTQDLVLIYMARIFAGLSIGAGYALLPVYISEISEDHNRGRLSQALNIFWSLGIFLCFAVVPLVSIQVFNIILGCISTVFFISFLLLAPESPYYLVTINEIDKAKSSLRRLRNLTDEELEEEIDKIKASLKKKTNRAIIKAFIICTVLIIAQQACCLGAILFYMRSFFYAVGATSNISSLIVAVFILSSSFLNPFFVDRTGRRFLTIVSCVGTFIALTLLGTFFYLQPYAADVEVVFWLPLFSFILFIFSFNFGISSIPWTLTSELFPTSVKNIASNLISIICWGSFFIVSKLFNSMIEEIGHYVCFWVFAGFCFLASIFSILFVPETKEQSFSEIQEMLMSGKIIHVSCCKGKNEKREYVVMETHESGDNIKVNGGN